MMRKPPHIGRRGRGGHPRPRPLQSRAGRYSRASRPPTASRALALVRASSARHLVVLDLMLPGMNGLEVCRALRSEERPRSCRSSCSPRAPTEVDKVLGLEIGADDYVTKPFSPRELLARVKAVLRRAYGGEPERAARDLGARPAAHRFRRLRGLPRRQAACTCRCANSSCSSSSCRIPERAFSRGDILDLVWGTDTHVEPRTVDVHVRRLRLQIERDDANPELILTVRGFGYKFKPDALDKPRRRRRREPRTLRRLSVQLLLPVVLVMAAIVLVAALYWSRAFERLYVQALTGRLEREARLAADALPRNIRGEKLDALCTSHAKELGGRITVIAEDGQVLGESEGGSESLENHAQRPEVIAAREAGTGVATRFSHTVGYDMLYVAVADRERPGAPFRACGAAAARARMRPRLGPQHACLRARCRDPARRSLRESFSRGASPRASSASKALSREVLAGAGEVSESSAEDELGALERHLVDLAREMRAQLARTEAERARLEAVLRGMVDGMVVLDPDGQIVLCNRAAIEQLELPTDGEPVGEKLSLRLPRSGRYGARRRGACAARARSCSARSRSPGASATARSPPPW